MGWRDVFEKQFQNRTEAGKQLAALLTEYAGRDDVIVLALPRGGVPVGYEVASALDAPLYAFIVRKLGAPGNPELAIGALASDGSAYVDKKLMADLYVDVDYLSAEMERQQAEIDRQLAAYGAALARPDVAGRTVILVDDGIATGSTTRAAVKALRQRDPAAIVLGVPVGSRDVMRAFRTLVDRAVVVTEPDVLYGVGAWYADFSQTPDEEVVRLLDRAGHGHDPGKRPGIGREH